MNEEQLEARIQGGHSAPHRDRCGCFRVGSGFAVLAVIPETTRIKTHI